MFELFARRIAVLKAMLFPTSQQREGTSQKNPAIPDRTRWEITIPMLKQLMASAGYSESISQTFLDWYRSTVLAAVGPITQSEKPYFDSFCNDDFSPIELSRNFQSGVSTIRVGAEPIGLLAGRKEDPFNQVAAEMLLRDVARQVSDVDLQWFHDFKQHLFVEQRKLNNVVAKMAPNEHMSVTTVSFNLLPNKSFLVPKVYFYPIIKSLETAIPGGELITEAITKIDRPELRFSAPLNLIKERISELKRLYSDPDIAKLESFSFDCIDPTQSRLKLYIRWKHTSVVKTCDFYTLGGRLSGPDIDGGLQAIKILWPLLTGITDPDEELPYNPHRTAGIIFNFELRPGQANPHPKVYIPVRHYCANDLAIAKALQAYFQQTGWYYQAANYLKDLRAAFPDQDFATTIGRHSYIGLSYSETTGIYLTVYYNTMLFSTGAERDEDGVLRGPAVKKQRHLHA